MPSKEVLEQYAEVRASLENAIKASDNVELCGEEENAELTYIRDTLSQLNVEFKSEIERLENSSEWDKFCMAFFGETNAGKSTIIEALRIIYDEESRRAELDRQEKQFDELITDERTKYLDLVTTIKHMNETLDLQNRAKAKKVLKVVGIIVVGAVIGFLTACLILL